MSNNLNTTKITPIKDKMINTEKKNIATLTNSHNTQLFTDLTPEQEVIVKGGRKLLYSSKRNKILFDLKIVSDYFTVNKGEDVILYLNTVETGLNRHKNPFYATLIRSRIGINVRHRKYEVNIGKEQVRWNNLPRGRYYIIFTDKKDSRIVLGELSAFAI